MNKARAACEQQPYLSMPIPLVFHSISAWANAIWVVWRELCHHRHKRDYSRPLNKFKNISQMGTLNSHLCSIGCFDDGHSKAYKSMFECFFFFQCIPLMLLKQTAWGFHLRQLLYSMWVELKHCKCTAYTNKAVPKEPFNGIVKSTLASFQTACCQRFLKNLYRAHSIQSQFIRLSSYKRAP